MRHSRDLGRLALAPGRAAEPAQPAQRALHPGRLRPARPPPAHRLVVHHRRPVLPHRHRLRQPPVRPAGGVRADGSGAAQLVDLAAGSGAGPGHHARRALGQRSPPAPAAGRRARGRELGGRGRLPRPPRARLAVEADRALLAARFQRGARAFVARDCDGRIAAWLWVSTGREWAEPLGRWLHLAGDECYAWGAGTRPEHRGRGLFTALLLASGRALRLEGRRLQWGGIHDSNLASQRANSAAGFRPVLQLELGAGTDLRTAPAPYADPRLVARALALLGETAGEACA